MKLKLLSTVIAAVLTSASAPASTIVQTSIKPGDSMKNLKATPAATDVGCLLLSNKAISAANEAKAKELASATQLFYLGRVSLLSESQIQAAMRSFPEQIDAETAGQMMNSAPKLCKQVPEMLKPSSASIRVSRPTQTAPFHLPV